MAGLHGLDVMSATLLQAAGTRTMVVTASAVPQPAGRRCKMLTSALSPRWTKSDQETGSEVQMLFKRTCSQPPASGQLVFEGCHCTSHVAISAVYAIRNCFICRHLLAAYMTGQPGLLLVLDSCM